MKRLTIPLLFLGALAFACLPFVLHAQTVTLDSVCAKRYTSDVDTASKRYLKSTTLTQAQKRATARLDGRRNALCQVVVNTPPPPPPPSGPVARFTSSCDSARCVLDASSSAGKIATFNWKAVARPDKTGSIIIRYASSDAPSSWTETLTVTDSAGLTDSTSRVVSLVPSTPPSPTPNPGPTPPPQPPPPATGSIVPPNAPFVYSPVQPTPSRTLRVAAGGDIQAALDSAKKGDEIVVAAGASFTGNFVLRAKSGGGWVTVRTSGTIPPSGTRVDSTLAPQMFALVSPNADGALKTAAGASGWWIIGAEIATAAPTNYGIALLGDGSSAQSQLSQVPQDIVLDRVYVHGSPTNNVSRGIGLNSGRTLIIDSYIGESHGKGFDTQAIGGWNGTGPYRIENTTLEGVGENFMLGGADPAIRNLVPCDVVFRRNHVITPAAWKGKWSKKNLFELKNACRVLVEGNVLDGSWADAQTGFGFMIYSTNQSGGCRACRVTDVMIRGNLLKNVAGGYNISGGQTAVDTVTSRIALIANVIDSVIYPNNNIMVQVLANGRDLTIDSLVAVGGGSALRELLVLDPKPAWTNMRYTNVVGELGIYGIFSSFYASGDASFAGMIAGAQQYGGLTVIGPQRAGYTASFVSSESQSPLAAAIRARVAAATAGVVRP